MVAASPTVRWIDTTTERNLSMSTADADLQQKWADAFNRMLDEVIASEQAKQTQGLPSITQQDVLQLLEREDEPMISVLSVLHRRLQAWEPFDDHETSESTGVLSSHSKAERMLAAAVCDLVNSLAEHQIDKTAEQLADQILAEVKAETLAYKSQTRVRLRRLINCVDQWQEKCPDDDERTQLVGICTELLHLCDHLGIIRPTEDGGAE
jgi:chemotaxis regulatin CheY-phosphate phosphatase CheZ